MGSFSSPLHGFGATAWACTDWLASIQLRTATPSLSNQTFIAPLRLLRDAAQRRWTNGATIAGPGDAGVGGAEIPPAMDDMDRIELVAGVDVVPKRETDQTRMGAKYESGEKIGWFPVNVAVRQA